MEMREALEKVVNGVSLDEEQARQVMNHVMGGKATPSQIAGLLTGLRTKGETEEEISGFARSMRSVALPLQLEVDQVMDTCGTGGDGAGTFNISTTAAFVLAAAGVFVAKHGNRSVSSNCGSADILEAFGVNLNLSPEAVSRSILEIGIGFLFAPAFHKAMKHAVVPRKELGIRTVFNLLGPLTNPAGAEIQVLGVYQEGLTEVLAGVLKRLGSKSAYVVHGLEGIDEVSISGPTRVSELRNGEIRTFDFVPEDAGVRRSPLETILGGDSQRNVQITREILAGERGPARDVVLLNSSFGLVAAGKAKTFKEGVKLAAEVIDNGSAALKIQQLLEFSRSCVA